MGKFSRTRSEPVGEQKSERARRRGRGGEGVGERACHKKETSSQLKEVRISAEVKGRASISLSAI